MRLSTKGRYGLRAMIELAQHYNDGPMSLQQIAENQNLSPKYLHALLTDLKIAGLVHAIRGSHGGFVLAQDPESIAVGQILPALEGSFSLTDCVEDTSVCERSDDCAARDMWIILSGALNDLMAKYTLADLAARMIPLSRISCSDI